MPASRREIRDASVGVIPVAAIFDLVIGGIYAGFFTPTPAAAIGVFLVGAYGLARRKIGAGDMRDSLLETASTSGMIYLILLRRSCSRSSCREAGCRRLRRPGSPIRGWRR